MCFTILNYLQFKITVSALLIYTKKNKVFNLINQKWQIASYLTLVFYQHIVSLKSQIQAVHLIHHLCLSFALVQYLQSHLFLIFICF